MNTDTTLTVVRCGTLIDGTGREPERGAALIVEDGVITAVEKSGRAPRGARVVDASELSIMPGLIDCHVHLNSLSDKTIQQRIMQPYTLSIAQALVNARTVLEAGFTTARDGSGTPRGLRMALEQGLFPGPRLRIAIAPLSQTAGHGDQTMPSGVNMRTDAPEQPPTIVDGVDAVRRATRELLRAGADQIKIYTSGGWRWTACASSSTSTS